MDAGTIQTILAGVILAGILWAARSLYSIGVDLASIKTTLVGQNGKNGLTSEVQTLRERSHAHGDSIHTLHGRQDLLAQRVDTIEERMA